MTNFFSNLSLDEILEIIQGLAVSSLFPSEQAFLRLHEFEQSGEDVEGKLRFLWGGVVLKKYLEFKSSMRLPTKKVPVRMELVQKNYFKTRYSMRLPPKNIQPTPAANDPATEKDLVNQPRPKEIEDAVVKRFEPMIVPEGVVERSQLAEVLIMHRINFFTSCCCPKEDGGEEKRYMLSNLNKVRNTAAGQTFLKEHLLFFENLDQELIRIEAGRRKLSARA